jgi:hypothetical protein
MQLPRGGWRHDGGRPVRSQARMVLRSRPSSLAIRVWVQPWSWRAFTASKRARRAAWTGFALASARPRDAQDRREADGVGALAVSSRRAA